MVERICPQCQHGNPLDNRFCGRCGASLERNELTSRPEMGLVPTRLALPAQLKHVGQAMAVSLAALAAEAGFAWLRRRVDHVGLPSLAHLSKLTALIPRSQPEAEVVKPPPDPVNSVVTIVSQRVVEIWDRDGLMRHTVERTIWRREG